MAEPKRPFDVKYTQARPGDKQFPPQWSAPFDEEFRPVTMPNAEAGAVDAYTSIGWHVFKAALKYTPAYNVVQSFNLRQNPTPKAVQEWENKTHGELTVTNRVSGTVYHLKSAFSQVEAVVSWFARESNMQGLVLCFSRQESMWYVETRRTELITRLGTDGTEVAESETATTESYLLEKHPNGFMLAGE